MSTNVYRRRQRNLRAGTDSLARRTRTCDSVGGGRTGGLTGGYGSGGLVLDRSTTTLADLAPWSDRRCRVEDHDLEPRPAGRPALGGRGRSQAGAAREGVPRHPASDRVARGVYRCRQQVEPRFRKGSAEDAPQEMVPPEEGVAGLAHPLYRGGESHGGRPHADGGDPWHQHGVLRPAHLDRVLP